MSTMITDKKLGSNRYAKYEVQPEQLCWNCKRCTNPDGLYCPWAAESKPVDGWTATKGREYFRSQSEQKTSIGFTYLIMDCPLFVKDQEFSTYLDALKHISEILGINLSTVRCTPSRYFKKYEAKTGEGLPFWVKNHSQERNM